MHEVKQNGNKKKENINLPKCW